MSRELNHDRMSLPAIPALKRKAGNSVEVWHNAPDRNEPVCIVLNVEPHDGGMHTMDLLPSEARALAALLINAADHQDRRAKQESA